MRPLFKFDVNQDTLIAGVAGIGMIVISILMIPFSGENTFNKIVSFFLRDVLMIFGLGIVFVSLFVDRKGREVLSDIGFTKNKITLSLILDVVFALALMGIFLKKGVPSDIINLSNFYAAVYIITAGIFEMTFIYGYLRMSFENAFGTIPAILLTSAFYSFHHAGFQPEFLHLFWVGIMYCSVFYITRNLLIIFPFFWAVGALWDVIVSSEAGKGIKSIESFGIAVIVWVLIGIWYIYQSKRRRIYLE